jgi:uncharacterized protein YecT (DUF1311 family)
LIIALLVVTGCATSAEHAKKRSAMPKITAPVIKETISWKDCPSSRKQRQTTVGSIACYGNMILRTDAKINKVAKRIFSLIQDKETRVHFVKAERVWSRYRKLSCKAEASLYRGGSEEPVMFRYCVVQRNGTHLRELTPFMKYLVKIRGR